MLFLTDKLLKYYTDDYILTTIFYFLLPISRESIIFGSNFRDSDFDGFARFWGALSQKIIFLVFCLSVCQFSA